MHTLYQSLEIAACLVVVLGPPVHGMKRRLDDFLAHQRWLLEIHDYPRGVPGHRHRPFEGRRSA